MLCLQRQSNQVPPIEKITVQDLAHMFQLSYQRSTYNGHATDEKVHSNSFLNAVNKTNRIC